MKKKLNMLLLILVILVASIVTVAPVPPPDPTPTPAECSPGFWKQPHHWQYWDAGFGPYDDYNSEMTYLEALQGGRDTRASRFIVAGLLNAANPDAPCGD